MRVITFLITFLALNSRAQVYLDLSLHQAVYDVDVIVFARQLSQPDADSISQGKRIDTAASRVLQANQEQLPMFRWPESEPTEDENWQVPIDESTKAVDALAWYLKSDRLQHPIIDRLYANPSWQPLLYRNWRQPATPFRSPEYVRVSTLPHQPIIEENAPTIIGMTHTEETPTQQVKPDYGVDGMVAFSKQQFIHLHVKVNFFRRDQEGQANQYVIDQKKRIKLDQWQYFDHQQFGVIAKVTRVDVPEQEKQGGSP